MCIRDRIIPESQSSIVTEELLFDNGFKALASYDSRYSKSKDFVFSIIIFDPKGNTSTDIRYGYGLTDPSGKETVAFGIALPNGIDTRILDAPIEGKYLMQIVLLGIGHDDFEKPLFQKFELNMIKSEMPKSEMPKTIISQSAIPKWIKNNAGWWADGQIDDSSFIQGIQFLIKEKIMNIPSTHSSGTGSNQIPSWIKNNAGWWANGQVSDSDFISGIQYMIQNHIIIIQNLPQTGESSGQVIPSWIKNNAGWWAENKISDNDFVKGIEFLVQHEIIKT